MGLFTELGRKAQRFSDQVTTAADETYVCPDCGQTFSVEYDECLDCGGESLRPASDS